LSRSVSAPGRAAFVRELRDCICDPAPDSLAVVIIGGRQLVSALGAFRLGLLAVALEHQVRGPPDLELRFHAAKAARPRIMLTSTRHRTRICGPATGGTRWLNLLPPVSMLNGTPP
jgi:hypothetical protein